MTNISKFDIVTLNIKSERGGDMPRSLLLTFFLVVCCTALAVGNSVAAEIQGKGAADSYKHKDLKSYTNLAKAFKSASKSADSNIGTGKKSHGVSSSHKGLKSHKTAHVKHKSHYKSSYGKHGLHKKTTHHYSLTKKHYAKKKTY